MLTQPLSCARVNEVVVFSTVSKNKDITRDYDCSDKMAPRFCSPGDLSRYQLRQRRLDIDAAKINFLRLMGLEVANPQVAVCALCKKIQCICDSMCERGEKIVDLGALYECSIKPCWIVIDGVRCRLCKKPFKCRTDVDDHMRKRHSKLKVVSKLCGQVISTRYVKKRHLKHPRKIASTHGRHQVTPSTDSGSTLHESLLTRHKRRLDFGEVDRLDAWRYDGFDSRSSSAPSLGVDFELPTCSKNCTCCVKNNRRPWDDNNNSYQKAPAPSEPVSGQAAHKSSEASSRRSLAASSSIPGPDWIQEPVSLINLDDDRTSDVILLDDESTVELNVQPPKPPCYDLSEDDSSKSDDEVQQVLVVRNNQKPFVTIKREVDQRRMMISDAIRDLEIAENSLSSHSQDAELVGDFYVTKEQALDDDSEDDFKLRLDDEEESYTQLKSAVGHYGALEKSNFWQTPAKNLERFSTANQLSGNYARTVEIKEELLMDHYMYDRS